MENFLYGNEQLEASIHALAECPDNEHMIQTMEILQERMLEGGQFLLPIERMEGEDGETAMRVRTLTMEDGSEVLVAFTSKEEAGDSEDTEMISNYMEPFLRLAAQTDQADGLTINPWGESVYIPKELLQLLFEGEEEYESQIKFELGDITQLDVECIVNAAKESLLGGSGVDGAIHKAAGPALLEECRTLGGCKTGEAKITKGYDLPADYVIHTVGPIYSGSPDDALKLAACYWSSLNLAMEHDIHSIAFPAISTGIYGYPAEQAAAVAMKAVFDWMDQNAEYPIVVTFCSYDQEMYDIYQALIRE